MLQRLGQKVRMLALGLPWPADLCRVSSRACDAQIGMKRNGRKTPIAPRPRCSQVNSFATISIAATSERGWPDRELNPVRRQRWRSAVRATETGTMTAALPDAKKSIAAAVRASLVDKDLGTDRPENPPTRHNRMHLL